VFVHKKRRVNLSWEELFMNILVSLCMVLALMLGGCCKKKYHEEKHHDGHTKKIKCAQLDDTVSSDAEFALAHADEDEADVEFDEEEFFDEASQELAEMEQELDDVQQDFDGHESERIAYAQDDDYQMTDDDYALADAAEEYSDGVYEEEPAHYAFKTITFPINGQNISSEQKKALDNGIETARQAIAEGKKVTIQGHSCQMGSPSYNMALSIQRANAVKEAMVKAGLDEQSIEVVGFGNELPVVWSDANNRAERIKDLAPNRRTEIIIS